MSKQASIWWDAINDSNMISLAWHSVAWADLPEYVQVEAEKMYQDAVRISLLKHVG